VNSVEPGPEDTGETADGRRLERGVEEEMHGAVVIDLRRQEEGGLTLVHLLERGAILELRVG